ncbi:MAG: FHA domain-containing protein [Oscillospiraceae bacterium]|jgi:hypothetical protein|nr:FHA domain-containing protein [Oscillospiraceae bacterium]
MRPDWYEPLAVAGQYWFALLAVIVVWRAFRWLRADARLRKKVLKELPDAGYIGTLNVLAGESRDLEPGEDIPLPPEGVLGSAAGCDAWVPHPTVSARHAFFQWGPEGLRLRPCRDEPLAVDGRLIPANSEAILRHGAQIEMGAVVLQLRLFAGLDAAGAMTPDGEALLPAKKRKPRRRKAKAPRQKQAPVSAGTKRQKPVNDKPQKRVPPTDDNPIYGKQRDR